MSTTRIDFMKMQKLRAKRGDIALERNSEQNVEKI